MIKLIPIEPEYVYLTIPAEYICVYHKIIAMMADYGEEMLKDCKANCTDRNSNVIECFNMFNSAIAARKLGKDKLAETIIKYIKAKINQIYKGKDNSTSFVFPVDENGYIKAFVSCGEHPLFEINSDDMNLYKHHYLTSEHNDRYELGEEDKGGGSKCDIDPELLELTFFARFEVVDDHVLPCGDLKVTYNGTEINYKEATIELYFDGHPVKQYEDVGEVSRGLHEFVVVVIYKHVTKVLTKTIKYETTD